MNVFTIKKKTDIVVGRKDGKLFAFNNSCPHKGASLSKGILKDDRIICYMHEYEYNIHTGRLENMKSWKKQDTWIEQNIKWRESNDLPVYKVMEKDDDGYIYIDIPNNEKE